MESLHPFLGAPENLQTARDIGLVALFLLLVDALFAYGPGARLVRYALNLRAADKKSRRTTTQAAARLVGCVFLAAVLPLAFRMLADTGLRADRLYASSALSVRCVSYTAGYFVYDLLTCLARFSDNGVPFLLHAVVCSAVYSYAAFSGQLHYYGAMFLLWECSTPFLYFRWALLQAGKAQSSIMGPANYVFAAVFFVCRNLLGPVMTIDFIRVSQRDMAHPRPYSLPPWVVYLYYVGGFTLNILNFVWLSQMLRAVRGGSTRHHTNKAV